MSISILKVVQIKITPQQVALRGYLFDGVNLIGHDFFIESYVKLVYRTPINNTRRILKSNAAGTAGNRLERSVIYGLQYWYSARLKADSTRINNESHLYDLKELACGLYFFGKIQE